MTDDTQSQTQSSQPAGDGSQAQTASNPFLSALPEAFRTSEVFTKHIDPATKDLSLERLANAHDSYARHFGVPADQLIRMPKADDQAGWDGLYSRLGRPEAADKYDLSGFTASNDGDKAFIENFRGEAFKLGMSQNQMSGMMAYLNGSVGALNDAYAKQIEEQRTAATAQLDQAWGDKAAAYRSEIPNTITFLAQKAGLFDPAKGEDGKAVIEALNADGLADNPALMRMLAVVADLRAERGSLPGTGKETVSITGKETAQAELDRLYGDKDFMAALNDGSHTRHEWAMTERQRLLEAMS